MHKGIYLRALFQFEPAGSNPPLRPGDKPGTVLDYPALLKDTMESLAPAWTVHSRLSHQIRRVRHEPPATAMPGTSAPSKGQVVSVLAYLEGEQDAPQDFAKLAIEQWQNLLGQVSQQLTAKRVPVKISAIEEDSDAVDELADEAAESNEESPPPSHSG